MSSSAEDVEVRRRSVGRFSTVTTTKDKKNPAKRSYEVDENMKLTRRGSRRYLRTFLKGLLVTCITLYFVVPIIARFCPKFHHSLVFLTFVIWPPFRNLGDPSSVGLEGVRNFYIQSEGDIQLGTWHILPPSLIKDAQQTESYYENSLGSGKPVFLYLHGNAGTRGGSHRIELYEALRKLDVHVVAFDYRGYADSGSVNPTEDGVVVDSKAVYKWLRQRVRNSPLYVWGHSLGTGVGTKLVKELCQEGDPPVALILEAPFNNLPDEVKHHPLSNIYTFLPWYDYFFSEPLRFFNLGFESDVHIKKVTVPVLILHAEDDNIVPFQLGYRLYEAALKGQSSSRVQFVRFDGDHSYRHRFICRAPEFTDTIKNFIKQWSP